ncbi:HPr family phosphocarrier protein [Paenibacillus sp. y28]|uniref:HPr family phosphocarrier protein n=1 Tax=Paenibacillus sp. y28 TaxID=3129110 RepID=UPI003015B8A1
MRVHEFVIQRDIERSDLAAISTRSALFMSDIKMSFHDEYSEHVVDVKSLLGMLLVPIKAGTTIRLVTQGKDEEEALHFIYDWFMVG